MYKYMNILKQPIPMFQTNMKLLILQNTFSDILHLKQRTQIQTEQSLKTSRQGRSFLLGELFMTTNTQHPYCY